MKKVASQLHIYFSLLSSDVSMREGWILSSPKSSALTRTGFNVSSPSIRGYSGKWTQRPPRSSTANGLVTPYIFFFFNVLTYWYFAVPLSLLRSLFDYFMVCVRPPELYLIFVVLKRIVHSHKWVSQQLISLSLTHCSIALDIVCRVHRQSGRRLRWNRWRHKRGGHWQRHWWWGPTWWLVNI